MKKTRATPKSAKRYPQDLVVSLDSLEIEDGFNSVKQGPVDDLVASFKEVGMENPIHVRHVADSELLFVIDGHRRYLAAQQAGLAKVRVIDHGFLDTPAAKLVAYRQNILRRKVAKKEVMDTVRCLDKAGYGGSEIARQMGLAKSSVSEYLTLTRASPKLRRAAEKSTAEGGIPTKAALQAAKLPKPEQDKAVPELEGKTSRQAEHVLPHIITDPSQAPVPTQSIGVLMPGEKLSSNYRLVSDYKERCQKLELEVKKRLRQTPSSQRLQGMELVIGVLRGKLTVDQAFVDWQKV
jgi:ParB/RepB/Spo0J family partition protein